MTTTHINTVEAKESFSDLINRVTHKNERIILTRRGNDIAAIIPIEDLHALESAQDKIDLQEAMESLQEARTQGSMTLATLKEQIG